MVEQITITIPDRDIEGDLERAERLILLLEEAQQMARHLAPYNRSRLMSMIDAAYTEAGSAYGFAAWKAKKGATR